MREVNSVPCNFQSRDIRALCYVDDLVIFAKPGEIINDSRSKFNKNLIMTNLGRPESVLEEDLIWERDDVNFSLYWLMQDHEMTQSKPMYTPMNWKFELRHDSKDLSRENQARKFCNIVHSLVYTTMKTHIYKYVAASTLILPVWNALKI